MAGNGTLKLRVSDNGPGAKGQIENAGIGLSTTRTRTERLYGKRATLRFDDSAKVFSVELEFPLMTTIPGGGE